MKSTILKKGIVAITGIFLLGFLFAHLTGNLLFFLGADAINTYAYFLEHSLHGIGIWLARLFLIISFFLHILFTIQLTNENKKSRGLNYVKKATIQASVSSRIMIISGITILLFVIYHIMHFTLHAFEAPPTFVNSEGKIQDNVFQMIVRGFSSFPITLFYIISVSFLCSHLSHGIASIFQTLGIRSKKNAKAIDLFAIFYTAFIWVGFLSIPISIFFFNCGK